ncbi:MAG: hypothetical protein M1830_010100 [Pleopsidium flavum]|nr:MAG: hypothetical protein M1830_010100 [Pleopsidium flavum]
MGTIGFADAQDMAAKSGGVCRTDPSELKKEEKEDTRTEEEKAEGARIAPRKQLKSLGIPDDPDQDQ